MVYVKINGVEYPAEVNGKVNDYEWDNRESKTITMESTYDEVKALFVDGVSWSIVVRDGYVPVFDENGNPTGESKEIVDEFDNGDYNMSGLITDNRDGTISIKMGKPTELEDAYAMILGGDV